MGYTHYWTQTRDHTIEEWEQICRATNRIFDTTTVPMALKGRTADELYFNGVGGDGHEDFVIYRLVQPAGYPGGRMGWDFCKTAYKPYDVIVTAVLCYLASIAGTYKVTSDGGPEDFEAGLALARMALFMLSNQLQIPDLKEDDE